jgi:hypothetical protein
MPFRAAETELLKWIVEPSCWKKPHDSVFFLRLWDKEVSEFIRWCATRLDGVALATGQYAMLIPLMLTETCRIVHVFASKINLDNFSMKLSVNIGDMKEQMVTRIREEKSMK